MLKISKRITVFLIVFLSWAEFSFADDGFNGFFRSANDKPYGWSKVEKPDPVRLGQYGQRFELRSGDCGSSGGWNDCSTDRERSEMSSHRKFHMGDEVWIAWSVFFPKNYWSSDDFNTCVGQIHQSGGFNGIAGGFESHPPLIQMETKEGYLSVMYHELSGEASNIEDRGLVTELVPLETLKGRWTDVMLHVKFSNQDGFLEVYLNGKKKYDIRKDANLLVKHHDKLKQLKKETNFIIFEPKDFFFKYGIYRSFISRYTNKTGAGVPTQVLYYDEVRVGNSRADVDLNGSQPPPPVD